MLINVTGRAHNQWGKKQLQAAEGYGEILDFPMPAVAASASEEDVDHIAALIVRRILRTLGMEERSVSETEASRDGGSEDGVSEEELSGHLILCQGDFTLVYRVVVALKERGLRVASPTYERVTKPTLKPDGTTVPGYSFEFVKFRAY